MADEHDEGSTSYGRPLATNPNGGDAPEGGMRCGNPLLGELKPQRRRALRAAAALSSTLAGGGGRLAARART